MTITPALNSAPLFALPVKEYTNLINVFLNDPEIVPEESEELIIDGIAVPTQVEFNKVAGDLNLHGKVFGQVI